MAEKVKVLITGANGMLGRTLQSIFSMYELVLADLPAVDITDASQFDALMCKNKPNVVVHCAAMTAVDMCEEEEDLAFKVNSIGSINVAAACHKYGSRLIAVSTDYVFDGSKDEPYNEFDEPAPQSVYGKSKLAGEQVVRIHCPNHVIVRISWLYGPKGPSFVHTMLKLADGSQKELKVVNDQVGNPTSTIAVGNALKDIIDRPELIGTFHLTCSGEATWYDFACEIFDRVGSDIEVIPCSSDEYTRPAPRPANSRLDKMALRLNGLPEMPCWKEALQEFINMEFLHRCDD